ncbi:Uncharacterised protein [Mycobacterium tuberculosis]|uniref:Uncharacterized protein n=1 Tax=Mycobacterium tuberculosis TaxID=1773 RepID=A0A655FW90_MYCTX|nr:Uncharacterised protein [Mycobacterium tuberculosis]CNV93418.1 Uncharacterised protein [Mycobacterium tuberculosis]CNW18588.1 Uncharacterised protein [Mycobacterium tuberculosis]
MGISAAGRRHRGHRHQLCQPPISHSRRADRREGGGRRRLTRSVAGARHAVLRGRHLGPHHLRGGRCQTAADFRRDACTRGQTAAGPLHRRAGASPTDRLSGVSCFPSQQMASLRQAGTFPARNRPVRRCGGQLQSHLRAGHDDDLTASRPPTTGAQSPQLSYERRPGRRTQSGHRQDHLSGVDDERNRRHQFPPRHR